MIGTFSRVFQPVVVGNILAFCVTKLEIFLGRSVQSEQSSHAFIATQRYDIVADCKERCTSEILSSAVLYDRVVGGGGAETFF